MRNLGSIFYHTVPSEAHGFRNEATQAVQLARTKLPPEERAGKIGCIVIAITQPRDRSISIRYGMDWTGLD